MSDGVTPVKIKRPRTIGRYSKEQHATASKRGWPLVHIEINDAYLPGDEGGNFSTHGPATPAFAEAIREIVHRYWKGEMR